MTNISQGKTGSTIRIAVDAMGGDHAPLEIIKGAIEASKQPDVEILLVGIKEQIEPELEQYEVNLDSITVIPSEGKIPEQEHPISGLRKMPFSSILVATRLVKEGTADALVTMGSTGAAMASSKIELGMFEGLNRPCLGGPFLGLAPSTLILDLGSNVDCKPEQLLNFAIMGTVFARKFFVIDDPKVGLLSVGSEPSKGNRQVYESYELFKNSNLNFIGNVEGNDLLTGKANVIVCDGFVGNIVMKFAEELGGRISEYVKQSLENTLGEVDLSRICRDIWESTNIPKRTGGPLLGVNGTVVIGHGASGWEEVLGAINTAKRCVELDLTAGIREDLLLVK